MVRSRHQLLLFVSSSLFSAAVGHANFGTRGEVLRGTRRKLWDAAAELSHIWGRCERWDATVSGCTFGSQSKCSDRYSEGPSQPDLEITLGNITPSRSGHAVHLAWWAPRRSPTEWNPRDSFDGCAVYRRMADAYPHFSHADFNGGNVRVSETGTATIRVQNPASYIVDDFVAYPHIHMRVCSNESYAHTAQDAVIFTEAGVRLVAEEGGSFLTILNVHNRTWSPLVGTGQVNGNLAGMLLHRKDYVHNADADAPVVKNYREVGKGYCRDDTCHDAFSCKSPFQGEAHCVSLDECVRLCNGTCAGFSWAEKPWAYHSGCRHDGKPRCLVYTGPTQATKTYKHADEYWCYRPEAGNMMDSSTEGQNDTIISDARKQMNVDALEFSPVYQCFEKGQLFDHFIADCTNSCTQDASEISHGQCVRKQLSDVTKTPVVGVWKLRMQCNQECWLAWKEKSLHYTRLALADVLDIPFQEVNMVALSFGEAEAQTGRRLQTAATGGAERDATLQAMVTTQRLTAEDTLSLMKLFLKDAAEATEIFNFLVTSVSLQSSKSGEGAWKDLSEKATVITDSLDNDDDPYQSAYDKAQPKSGGKGFATIAGVPVDDVPVAVIVGIAVTVVILGCMFFLWVRYRRKKAITEYRDGETIETASGQIIGSVGIPEEGKKVDEDDDNLKKPAQGVEDNVVKATPIAPPSGATLQRAENAAPPQGGEQI
eukprot:TRINITY_DN41442_c0_g1_i1.p1 TRINITY_DN41442_c0_g1~~TRINITY_DN41442_c0_g1_i1.p1  ORF type:complete len:723 (-),score=121.71 TRINITY_DN41442_c0_g1_i1:37-2169(-)